MGLMRRLLDTLSRELITHQAIALFTTVGIDVGGVRKGSTPSPSAVAPTPASWPAAMCRSSPTDASQEPSASSQTGSPSRRVPPWATARRTPAITLL